MQPDTLLSLNQTVDALVDAGFPVTRCSLRNSIVRGSGPKVTQRPHDQPDVLGRTIRHIAWKDALIWAEARSTWYEPRTIRMGYTPRDEDENLAYLAVLDQIVLTLKAQHPKLFDRILKLYGPDRIGALNAIAIHALEFAETELLEFCETLRPDDDNH